MATLYVKSASQSTHPKDSQKYAGVVSISMFGPLNLKPLWCWIVFRMKEPLGLYYVRNCPTAYLLIDVGMEIDVFQY